MQLRGLVAWLAILALTCAAFVAAALTLGKSANLVAALYMFTPALAAVVARAFFHPARFSDAALRPGPLRSYVVIWLGALGLVLVQFAGFVASGAVSVDTSGGGFLAQVERVMPGGSKTMLEQLPAGMSLQGMLALYTVGGLTVFNVPGVLLGFGEEFGWRGFLFRELRRFGPAAALVGGGLIWFAWHAPLSLLSPPALEGWARALDAVVLAVGAVASFTLFAWLFVRTQTIWAPSLLHAVLNNGSRALSYWIRIDDQLRADVVLTLSMVLAVALLWRTGRLAALTAPTLHSEPGRGVATS